MRIVAGSFSLTLALWALPARAGEVPARQEGLWKCQNIQAWSGPGRGYHITDDFASSDNPWKLYLLQTYLGANTAGAHCSEVAPTQAAQQQRALDMQMSALGQAGVEVMRVNWSGN